ncbi:hypothetical protein MAA_11648 [Metarhizium robertsii ARSEF 23]|uniref:Cytochrome P450 n=1 Tax=Metarhizium robertsii (strain ARSEF 23 / ATCC MYA-3075) TaxID=655844 RepID=A0A0B2XFD5_METRA|nr:uncharacterized protein MAA_11648 [Metarhizium robertsii ARSEF 23]KHO10739.1 hypothetical protein MAA_11648 [Metarhizium robertsii ARSEF 23]
MSPPGLSQHAHTSTTTSTSVFEHVILAEGGLRNREFDRGQGETSMQSSRQVRSNPEREGYDCLKNDDFQKDFKRILLSAVQTGAFIRQLPWVVGLVRRIPPWVVGRISKDFLAVLNWEGVVRRRVESFLIEKRKLNNEAATASVLTRLLDNDLPDDEKSFQRLVDEGKSLMGVGSKTTSWTLTLLIYLALVQLKLAAALLFTQYNFEFVNTTEKDVLPVRDSFISRPVADSDCVRAKIVKL